MSAVTELAEDVGVSLACRAFSLPRSTFYRWSKPAAGRRQPRPTPARALSKQERSRVYEVLCSERTMYRDLAKQDSVRERRRQRTRPPHPKPRLVARRPKPGVVMGHHGTDLEVRGI